ncbi:1-Phosphatidylinositol 4,5-Bisphosphate Phosphodiesterase Gamma-1 [Manis pentadactyla]|nr:1-Phosphatidylinositol 4,5-Bisphosphate Phosphodiesterase Gamma-1 [Manis pentadactyla]
MEIGKSVRPVKCQISEMETISTEEEQRSKKRRCAGDRSSALPSCGEEEQLHLQSEDCTDTQPTDKDLQFLVMIWHEDHGAENSSRTTATGPVKGEKREGLVVCLAISKNI